MTAKMAITIIETEIAKDGGYIPCVVKEGETGYHKTDWNWGPDLNTARELADNYNLNLGLSKEEAVKLVIQSFPKPSDIHKSLDNLRSQNSEAVLEWIRENVHPDLDLDADVNPADITDWTLEWD